MTSPAQKHRMRVLAEKAAEQNGAGLPATGTAYALMMAALVQDLRRLKDIQSIQSKTVVKAEMVGTYQDYLDGVLAGNSGAQDEVLVTVMVWHIDVGDFRRGLDLAAYALTHKLNLPERYQRTVPVLLLDEVADAVLTGRTEGNQDTLDVLQRVAELTSDHDAPDQARAKLHRAIGETLAIMAGDEPSGAQLEMARAALAQFNRAVSLHAGVGAKKAIERLERLIKKAGTG